MSLRVKNAVPKIRQRYEQVRGAGRQEVIKVCDKNKMLKLA